MQQNAQAPVPQLDENYQILEVIGTGGMATVYKAHHASLGLDIAVKILDAKRLADPAAVQRFRNESKILSQLSHPNIVRVYHFRIAADHSPYIGMELLTGDPLDKVLASDTAPIEVERAIEIVRQTLGALQYAHEQGIIHRDVKPGNLYPSELPPGKVLVKVADFGIAKMRSSPGGEYQRLTQTGVILGTPLYMSPEQCMSADCDQRADIYSLGCVFYQLICGVPPFACENSLELMMMHTVQDAEPITKHRELPESLGIRLDEIIHKMMAKRPDERYQSCAEVLAELDDIHGKAAETSSNSNPIRHSRITPAVTSKDTRKRFTPAPILIAAATLVIGIGLVAFFQVNRATTGSNNRSADSTVIAPDDNKRFHDKCGRNEQLLLYLGRELLDPKGGPLRSASALDLSLPSETEIAEDPDYAQIATGITELAKLNDTAALSSFHAYLRSWLENRQDDKFKFNKERSKKPVPPAWANHLIRTAALCDYARKGGQQSPEEWIAVGSLISHREKRFDLSDESIAAMTRKFSDITSAQSSPRDQLAAFNLATALGRYYEHVKQWSDALHWYDKASSIAEASKLTKTPSTTSPTLSEQLAYVYNYRGKQALFDGKLADAEALSMSAVNLSDGRDDDREFKQARFTVGCVRAIDKRYKESINELLKFPLARKPDIARAKALNWLAYDYMCLGKQDDAAQTLTEAQDVCKTLKDTPSRAEEKKRLNRTIAATCFMKGRMAQLARQSTVAESMFKQGIALWLENSCDYGILDWVEVSLCFRWYEELVSTAKVDRNAYEQSLQRFKVIASKYHPISSAAETLSQRMR